MAPEDDTEDFAALLAEYEKKTPITKKKRDPQVGDMVRGRVSSIGQEALFVDLGTKSEGMIELVELRDADGKLTVAVGDEIEARVVETAGKAGCVVLRRSLLGKGPEAKAELEQAFSLGIPIEGVVTAVNKGGVEVQVAGVRGFCPISQLDLKHVEDANLYVGQRHTFRITRYETTGRTANLVLSRRAILEDEARVKAAETRARLSVGAVLKGTVSALKDYGAFIDLGGIEGMLHISELGFARVAHPKDVLSVGQPVEVQVLKIEKSDDPRRPDRKTEKISLSLKSLEKDPWEDALGRWPQGTRLKGAVVRVEPFGAFVELAPGVEGLIHVSELAAERQVRHAKDVVKVGDRLEVVVLSVERDRRRISLTMAAKADAAAEEREAIAQHRPTGGGLGTFGDLLAKSKKRS